MENMTTGLLITAIGMGLVFAMIVVLWGMMIVLVNLTSNKKQPEIVAAISESDQPTLIEPNKAKLKAAAAAVAAAFWMKKPTPKGQNNTENYNMWQAASRFKQIQNQIGRGKHL